VLGQILLDVFHRVFLDSLVLYRGIEVVEYRIERDVPVLDGFEAQQGVVDAAQLSGGDKDKRDIALDTVLYNLYPTVEDKTIQEDTMKYIKQYLSKHFPGTKFEVVPEIV
jgi:dethiobiotin synthetase